MIWGWALFGKIEAHYCYARYVLRHKWYVFIECFKLGILWRGILHDMSKLLPSEWISYTNYFYGDRNDAAFDVAWLLHQKRNRHHWQWWILLEDEGSVKILPMSDSYRREMLADWYGAGRALGMPDIAAWYSTNKANMQLHPDTRNWIEAYLC